LIYRFIKLYTNPGEIVFSPFAGCGSEGYIALGGPTKKRPIRAIQEPRRFYGCEIKPEYIEAARVNFGRVAKYREQQLQGLLPI
jgi:DNA modification methylase